MKEINKNICKIKQENDQIYSLLTSKIKDLFKKKIFY